MVKTRFAPSPTGYLHVGGLRTALYSYLLAKKHGGVFVLRIEDTDQVRTVEGGVMNILRSLNWAGIQPDEGVCLIDGKVTQKGENGPYIQSERLSIYAKYAKELLDREQAYYCFCSKERLDELRKIQQLNKQPTGYDGFCRNLSKNQVEENLLAKKEHVIRMKMPKEGVTIFNDLIRGTVEFKNELIDDQVIIKSDGFPTYHLAVVIDDHLMGITHAVRGEEWLSSTPKHLVLYKMFDWQPPEFAHLPLLLNPDKSKLSKRQGDVAVEDYKAKGYLPEAMINFVAFLGWNPGTEKEIYNIQELTNEFIFSRVNKAGAVFNLEKLDWYNEQYIRKMNLADFTEFALPFLSRFKDDPRCTDFTWLQNVVSLFKDRLHKLSDLESLVSFIFIPLDYSSDMLIWKKSNKDETRKNLTNLIGFLSKFTVQDWKKELLELKVGDWIKQEGLDVGSVLWPMRVAMSGQKNSPGPFEIAFVLGKDETLNRLKTAIQIL